MITVALGSLPDWVNWISRVIDPKRFKTVFGAIEPHMELRNFDCALPFTFREAECLRLHSELNGRKFWIPSSVLISLCEDKLLLNERLLASEFHYLIPPIYNRDDAPFPYILKKRKSYWGEGTYLIENLRTQEQYSHCRDDAEYFMQEAVEGQIEYALHLFMVGGKALYSLTVTYEMSGELDIRGHKKQPLNMKIEHGNPFLDIFENLLIQLEYVGVCCINYKMKDSLPALLEINPRMGGSLCSDINNFLEIYYASLNSSHPASNGLA